MYKIQKTICALLLLALIMCVAAVNAENFQNDLDGIDKAAESVLRLDVYNDKNQLIAIGSGFVAFDKNTIVTSYHIVENADWILATCENGLQYIVNKPIAFSEEKDIALLEFLSAKDMEPLTISQGRKFRRAEPVVVIGNLYGMTNSVSLGNISALNIDGDVSYIQLTTPLSPDSSGGALLDNRGEVIGVITAVYIDHKSMNLAVDIGEIIELYKESKDAARVDIRMHRIQVMGLDASAAVQSELISMIYSGTNLASNFERAVPVVMNDQLNYASWSGAVLTFRGGPFRQNAAYGTVDVQENKLEVIWSVPMGGIASYYGAGWTGQPAIVKWTKEVREMMNLMDEKKAVVALKEVILASQDGKVYFLDLADGQPTRNPINVGQPLSGSISVDPRGMPMLSIGQGAYMFHNANSEIGYSLFELINQKRIMFINGLDMNAFGSDGTFNGTSLIDRNSDTLIIAGGNGMLYTVPLNTTFDIDRAKMDITPEIVSYKAKASDQKESMTGIDGSVAMFRNFVYFADASGILQCVDVNTMKPVWAVDTGNNTDASIALDYDEDGTLALYTGNTAEAQGKNGICTIRRLSAMTGEQEWSYTVNVEYDTTEISGCMASPVVGQLSIGNLVIFTVAKTPEGGRIIAFDKITGHVVWQQPVSSYSWSSPVAVYNENGDAWIIQGDSKGVLQLMDGKTGVILNSIKLEGSITGSPAVYNNMLVVGTRGNGVSRIYGVKIK